MPRKKCFRHVESDPNVTYYKPAGIPLKEMEQVVLNIDEYEAIRLADLVGMYQEEAAKSMKVSRQTFGRILTEAHSKIANALVNGKAIKIEKQQN